MWIEQVFFFYLFIFFIFAEIGDIFLFFLRKGDLTFRTNCLVHANCLLKILPRMLSVKLTI